MVRSIREMVWLRLSVLATIYWVHRAYRYEWQR